MSSISFPSGNAPTEGSSSHDTQFYAQGFDPSVSFQMNPHSSHPPRTPRTSVISTSSHHYGAASLYDMKEEQAEEPNEVSEESDDEEVVASKPEASVRKEDVWREMFLTSYGRDKALKLIQYSIRMSLLFRSAFPLRRLRKPLWEEAILKRLEKTAAGLSFARRTLLLFNWLAPLTAVLAQQSVPFSAEQSKETSQKRARPFLHTLLYAPPPVLLELVNAIADDVATFARLGLFGKKTEERATRFSDWCWLLSTIAGLVENALERQINNGLQSQVESRLYSESMTGATEKSKAKSSKHDDKEYAKLQKQDYWLQITRAKLVMDLIFVSYDIFKIRRAREFVKVFTGLAAAILSSTKLYDRHKTSLLKTINIAA